MEDTGKRMEFNTGAVREPATGKGRYDLISPEGIRRLALWSELGAIKYDDRNWEKGIPASRCLDSALRHLNCFMSGNNTEDHLAAAVWNLFAIMHFEEHNPECLDLPFRRNENGS